MMTPTASSRTPITTTTSIKVSPAADCLVACICVIRVRVGSGSQLSGGQGDLKVSSAPGLRVNCQRPAMFFDDATCSGQAQARAAFFG